MANDQNALVRKLSQYMGDIPTLALTSFFTDTANLYDVLGVQPGVEYYLNLGWWTDELQEQESMDEETITEACRELVRQFASFGDVNPDDVILDVGFGFGQQDLLLVREFNCRDITGINITPHHVKKGRELVESQGASDRINLHLGDAVRLPYPDQTFDRVLALESAFHFRTRQEFFKEAHRVLKDGGTLVTADIINGPDQNVSSLPLSTVISQAHERYWNIPEANRIDPDGYRRSLSDLGFRNVRLRDVSDRVIEPWVRNYVPWRLKNQPKPVQWVGTPLMRLMINFYREDYFRYVFARADK